MINLLEKFDQSSADFIRSQYIAKMKIPTVVMHDDGFLPPEVDSATQYFCDLKKSNHQPLYFDQVKVPPYWRITADATKGEIWDLKTKRGQIEFTRADNHRFVKTVTWLDDAQQPCWMDHYDRYGRRFAKTYFAQGQPRVRKFFNRKGEEVIEYNMVADDVFLNSKGHKRHFTSYAAFIAYYLKLRHYRLDHVFYNTLNQALAVSMLLPKDGEDVLFWNEPIVNNALPGNMQYLMENKTRTKHVIFQNYREWVKWQSALPKDTQVDFDYLGMIYPHPRGNSLNPQALIVTSSDQIERLEELADALPKVTFNVVAVTNMSEKLMSQGHVHNNIKLYPRVAEPVLRRLLTQCDLYFDINHGPEMLDAVRGAFEQNMLILGFSDTLHEPRFVSQQNVFDESQYENMARQVLGVLVNPQQMGNLVDEQRKEASDMWPKNYQRVLGKWVK